MQPQEAGFMRAPNFQAIVRWVRSRAKLGSGAKLGSRAEVVSLRQRKGQPMWRQGDLFIAGVDRIPERARRSPVPHGILVHGELTGHSHRLENAKSAAVFAGSHHLGELYLDVPAGGTRIVHEEHGPIELPHGFYRAWRQREYSPQAIRVVQD